MGQLEQSIQVMQSSYEQSMQALQVQLAQLLQNQQVVQKGKLPAQPVQNPRGQLHIGALTSNDPILEHIKWITTLPSDKTVDNKVQMPTLEPNIINNLVRVKAELDNGDTLLPSVRELEED